MGENIVDAEIATNVIMEDVIFRGGLILYDHYIEEKSIPFTVDQSLGILANTIEFACLRHDTGEPQTWPLEVEPQAALIDTWARSAVPVKKKIKIVPPAEPTHQAPDSRSIRSFRSSRSRLGGMGESVKRTTGRGFLNQAKTIEEGNPIPVSLNLPTEEITSEEEMLRVEKERESKKKKEEYDRQARIKHEEEERERMLLKKAEELKNKPFTYDHRGNIMLVNGPKFERMPNPTLQANYQFPDLVPDDTQKKPIRRRVTQTNTKDVQPALKRKVPPNAETEWVRNVTSVQPPIFDSIKLNNGITMVEGNRVKNPPKQVSQRTMSRKEYGRMTELMNKPQSAQSSLNKATSMDSISRQSGTGAQKNKQLIEDLPDYEQPAQGSGRLARHDSSPGLKSQQKGPYMNQIRHYDENMDEEDADNEIDKFNIKIMRTANWGANPPLRKPNLPDRMPVKLDQRQAWEIHADKVHKPKDKPFLQVSEIMQEGSIKKPRDRPYVERVKAKQHKPPPPFGRTVMSARPY